MTVKEDVALYDSIGETEIARIYGEVGEFFEDILIEYGRIF